MLLTQHMKQVKPVAEDDKEGHVETPDVRPKRAPIALVVKGISGDLVLTYPQGRRGCWVILGWRVCCLMTWKARV